MRSKPVFAGSRNGWPRTTEVPIASLAPVVTRFPKFALAAAVVLAVLWPMPRASAVVTVTVRAGGSADVFLTVNSSGSPRFSARGAAPLVVTFSEVVLGNGEDEWATTMTVDAANASSGTYDFNLIVDTPDQGQLVESVAVTAEGLTAAITTSAASAPAQTTSTTTALQTTTTVAVTADTASARAAPSIDDGGLSFGMAAVVLGAVMVLIGSGLTALAWRRRQAVRSLRLPDYRVTEEE